MYQKWKSILPLLLLFSFFSIPIESTARIASTPRTAVQIVVNGQFIQSDLSPITIQSQLLVPLRALSSLGLSFEWENATGVITIYNHLQGQYIEVVNDSRMALRNGESIEMNLPVQIHSGRTMIPLRAISELFDYTVQYETVRKMVFIQTPDYEFNPAKIEQSNLQAARLAAIALPIQVNFQEIGLPLAPHHSYIFHAGRADMYKFSDQRTTSYVEIIDGEAILIGQHVSGVRGQFAYTSGSIGPQSHADSLITQYYYGEHYEGDPVSFVDMGDGTAASFYHKDGEEISNIIPLLTYPDLIQALPDNY